MLAAGPPGLTPVSWETEYPRATRPGRPAVPAMGSSAVDGTGDGTGEQTVAGGRAEEFLAMSALLTGYARGQLAGTGLTSAYLRAVDGAVPGGVLDDLLVVFGRLRSQLPPASDGLEASVAGAILDDPMLGPVARNIILMWYCGTWTALSEDWHAAYGTPNRGTTPVVPTQEALSRRPAADRGGVTAGALAKAF